MFNGPRALAASKKNMQRVFDRTNDEAWHERHSYARAALRSEDRKKGLRAFVEK
jgi:enoyl-CoA hydratase/carnithine racemase